MKSIIYKGKIWNTSDADLPEELKKKFGIKKRPARNPKPKAKEKKEDK